MYLGNLRRKIYKQFFENWYQTCLWKLRFLIAGLLRNMYLLELVLLRKYTICNKMKASVGALSHSNPFRSCAKRYFKPE